MPLVTLLATSERTGTPEVMGIPRQEIKTASSGPPDNKKKRRFKFVCGDLKGRNYAGIVTNPCYLHPKSTINDKRKHKDTLPFGKRLTTQVPKPSHYKCPEGPAFIEAAGKRICIRVLLDSGSNIFLINKDLVKHFDIPYETHQKALNILAFDGEVNSSGGKHFTHPILLEIGKNGHRTHISCEVAAAGKYDLIIPFGWWQQEHPIAMINETQNWTFTEQCCLGHVKDEGVGGMFEWD